MNVYSPLVPEPMIERVIEDLCNDPDVIVVRVDERQGGPVTVSAMRKEVGQ